MPAHRIYLKEWRKFRGYTLEQVVDRLAVFDDEKLPKTGASLSRIENRKQQYSERIVEALADVYQCEVTDLLGRDPHKQGSVIDLVAMLDERQRRQAIAIIEALLKDGTNG